MNIQSDEYLAAAIACFAWILTNPAQVVGTVFGIGGAMVLAMKCKASGWAWPAWLVSNAAWTWYAFSLPDVAYGLIAQQIVFGLINVVGAWTWLVKNEQVDASSPTESPS